MKESTGQSVMEENNNILVKKEGTKKPQQIKIKEIEVEEENQINTND